MQAKEKSRKSHTKMELYVSWMLGGLLLLIANSTIFNYFGASIGDPWFNLLLSALVLFLLGKIAVTYLEMQHSKIKRKSNISAIDSMNGAQFAEYMAAYFRNQGWSITVVGEERSELIAERNGERRLIILRASKRKLTPDTFIHSAEAKEWYGAGGMLIITNGSYTSRAKQEADIRDIELWDRKLLIRELAKINAAWKFKAIS